MALKVAIRAGSKEELLKMIERKLGTDVTEVYINARLTKEIVVAILENAPNIRKISCPPSLYGKVSKKIAETLRAMNIEFTPEETRRGRPSKYDEKTRREVIRLIKLGKKPREISAEKGIPLRTVYYFINGKKVRQG